MTPIRLAIASLAAAVSLAATQAHAGYRHAPRDWVEAGGFCRYEAATRGLGPTYQYMIVYRCYPPEILPGRPWRGGYVLRSRG